MPLIYRFILKWSKIVPLLIFKDGLMKKLAVKESHKITQKLPSPAGYYFIPVGSGLKQFMINVKGAYC